MALATANPTWSNVGIARHMNVDEATVRRGLKAAGYQRHLVPVDTIPRITLERPIKVTAPAIITADWHSPLTDYEYVNKMILEARERGIRTLVIGGDFFNLDALSDYMPKQADDEAGLERELREGIAVMRVLLESFDRIVYVWGNHDSRLHKALGYKLKFASAMRLVFGALGEEAMQKIEFTNLDHCIVEPYPNAPKWETWRICHPANYSSVPGTTARALASKEGQHVITAHSHHCAVMYATNGYHVAAEIGGLFDADKTSYLQRTTKFPNWQNGYGIINESNKLELRSPGWTL